MNTGKHNAIWKVLVRVYFKDPKARVFIDDLATEAACSEGCADGWLRGWVRRQLVLKEGDTYALVEDIKDLLVEACEDYYHRREGDNMKLCIYRRQERGLVVERLNTKLNRYGITTSRHGAMNGTFDVGTLEGLHALETVIDRLHFI